MQTDADRRIPDHTEAAGGTRTLTGEHSGTEKKHTHNHHTNQISPRNPDTIPPQPHLLSRNAREAVVQAVLIPEEVGPQSARNTGTKRFSAAREDTSRRSKNAHGHDGNTGRVGHTRVGKQGVGEWR